ncbi:MAG TPA: ferritin-like domain-containing protein, partial [Gemmatimonadales bacterium]|nr:ferritin-like domain-containing protein [Gemmatimonadales bacterium]
MAKLSSLDDLLVHELQDIYHAEGQTLKALPRMAKAATHAELKRAFDEHRIQTERQVQRLEQVFALLGHPVKGRKCEGMAGLLEEGKKVMAQDADPSVLDAALIAAAQKVEHYEIAAYGCVCTYAEMLGYDQV